MPHVPGIITEKMASAQNAVSVVSCQLSVVSGQ